MILPFSNNPYRVTSPYGVIRTLSGLHRGIDLVCDIDPTIYAACDGKIVRSRIVTDHRNKTWEWGNYITIYDGTYHIIYAHLAKRFVESGADVRSGDPIGLMGNTGYSTGEHLHLEVRIANSQNPVHVAELFNIPNCVGSYNPAKYIDMRGYVIRALSLSDQTVAYLDAYTYSDDLYGKIYAAINR